METRANYLLVGLFVIVMTAGLFVFALWLGRAQFETDVKRYEIYFVGSVTGLKKGSQVSYRGITVGEVVNLEIDPKNFERVLVTVEIQANTPVRDDTIARLEVQGIAGVPFVMLTGGTLSSPPLEVKEGERYPVIHSAPSRLEELLSGAPELVDRIEALLASANEVLNPKNREAISNTLTNFEAVSETVAGKREDISQAVSDFTTTMANLRDASATFEKLVTDVQEKTDSLATQADSTLKSFNSAAGTVDREVKPLLEDLRQASRSIAAAAEQMAKLVDENRGPINNFASNGLSDLNAFISESRQLVDNLNRISTEFERDPARFLFGNQQQGYDAPTR